MSGSSFVYVTFIRTTPDKLWDVLTNPEFQRQYWFDQHIESDWKKGSAWKLIFPDGKIADSGEVIEIEPGRRLVISWNHHWRPELTAEGEARCEWEIEPAGETVKLTVTHTIPVEDSKLITAVSGGWPKILSNVKSLLETGKVLAMA